MNCEFVVQPLEFVQGSLVIPATPVHFCLLRLNDQACKREKSDEMQPTRYPNVTVTIGRTTE